jgi:V-type H+-transporting ATPase 16kDa proteolipid subunit
MYDPYAYLSKLGSYKVLGLGAAYGTAKSGIGIAGIGTYRPDLIMKVKNLSTSGILEKY